MSDSSLRGPPLSAYGTGVREGQVGELTILTAIRRLLLVLAGFCLIQPAVAASDNWDLFGYEALWDGHSVRELDARRWSVLVAPVGSRDAVGGLIVQSIANGAMTLGPLGRLAYVNRIVNSRPYIDDIKQFGKDDVWQYAEEFLRRGGECKDYAVAKYRILVEAGFPERDLRIVLVDDRITKAEHAVLAARVDGMVYILDNQVRDVRPESYVNNYRPLYAFNRRDVLFYPTDAARRPLPDLVVSARSR